MEKLRIKKGNFYEIEVNDKGDTIIFDLDDIELPFKLNDAFLATRKAANRIKQKEKEISSREDKKYGFVSSKDEAYRQLYKNAYSEMRNAMDIFLGEGGCQKIFGSRNYLSMYDDLFEALQPHLKKMGLSIESTNKRIAEKYGKPEDDTVLS